MDRSSEKSVASLRVSHVASSVRSVGTPVTKSRPNRVSWSIAARRPDGVARSLYRTNSPGDEVSVALFHGCDGVSRWKEERLDGEEYRSRKENE